MENAKKSNFIESLKYSRDKCMLFHGLNILSIMLFILFYTVVLNEFKEYTYFLVLGLVLPILVLLLSFYLVSRHDLTYIEMKREEGTAIWRDNIEYKISKFAKMIFFQK